MKVCKAICVAIVLAFWALLPLSGQEARGTLLGRVTDPSDAVIPGAQVEALNTATGVSIPTTTNESGDYLIPYLIPGPYTIKVQSGGFKNYTRSGIVLRINDRLSIDATMQLGAQSDAIEVSASSPLLDTSTVSMGQVVTSRSVLELPLKDGWVGQVATFSPGVLFMPNKQGSVRPFDENSVSQMTIDGKASRPTTSTRSRQWIPDTWCCRTSA